MLPGGHKVGEQLRERICVSGLITERAVLMGVQEGKLKAM